MSTHIHNERITES